MLYHARKGIPVEVDMGGVDQRELLHVVLCSTLKIWTKLISRKLNVVMKMEIILTKNLPCLLQCHESLSVPRDHCFLSCLRVCVCE